MNASNDTGNDSSSNGNGCAGTRGKVGRFGWTFANACILGMTAWIAFSNGGSPFASRAEAGAPPASTRNAALASEPPAVQVLDSGFQRAEMVNELQAVRRELAEIRALIGRGVQVEVSNVNELRAAIEAAAKTR
ncbi:MAG: hypothetical protein RLZZ116_729 [Planctomycetota bacterium]|jgi:hypothetical protein